MSSIVCVNRYLYLFFCFYTSNDVGNVIFFVIASFFNLWGF
jgi:hypothetical protein